MVRRIKFSSRSNPVNSIEFPGLSANYLQLQALAYFSQCLCRGYTARDLLSLVPNIAKQGLNASAASLQLYDSRHNELKFFAIDDPLAPNLRGYSITVRKGIGGEALRTGVPTAIKNTRTAENYNNEVEQKFSQRHIEALLTVPIRSPQGAGLGVIQVVTVPARCHDYDLKFLQVLAALAQPPLNPTYELPAPIPPLLEELDLIKVYEAP